MKFRLAHLTDLHLAPPPQSDDEAIFIKQRLGHLSWHYHRRHLLRPEVCDALLADLACREPDHIAITGDVVNFSQTTEFVAAAAKLHAIAPAERLSVVPGNHDELVVGSGAIRDRLWAPFMRSDGGGEGVVFPYCRRRGDIALIGVSTACPTSIFHAWGRLGAPQIARLEAILEETGREQLFRVVMMHHPPIEARFAPRKHLRDAELFCRAIARCGAELILHGHTHRHGSAHLPGPDGSMAAVMGLPAASACGPDAMLAAHYALDEITRRDTGWYRRRRLYGYEAATGRVIGVDEA